jgi:hypothetical protein
LAGGQSAPASLQAIAPRQAVLVCYCPSLERLGETWNLFVPLLDSDDILLGTASAGLEELDKGFLRVWSARGGVTMGDLAAALPGEVLLGWMPRSSKGGAAFRADDWVLIARRLRDRDEAVRNLWQRVVSRMAKGGQSERLQLAGVAVEQVTWEENTPSELTVPRSRKGHTAPREFGASDGAKSISFDGIRRIERRALSLGLSENLVFFSPSRAERLGPWIAAAVEHTGAVGLNAGLRRTIQGSNEAGELVLALQATPPAWASSAQTDVERRLGARPDNVLLSQARLLNGVIARRGDQIILDAEATVLPMPGWAAQILATLGDGAAFSATDNLVGEISVRADLSRLWTTLHGVLDEGWPVVGFALDTFLAPLGGQNGDGAALLAATLGIRAATFSFRPSRTDEIGRSWAIAVEVRDRERFAQLEPRLETLLETFTFAPARYDVGPDGRLRGRAQTAATSAPAVVPRLCVAQWNSYFIIGGSRGALEKAIQAVSAKPAIAANPVRLRLLTDLLRVSRTERRPAIAFYSEATAGLAGGRVVGGRVRRTIQTPDGEIILDSPPPPRPSPSGRSSSPPTKSSAAVAPNLLARLVGAVVVESENSVRIRVGVQPVGAQTPGPPSNVKRPPASGEKRPTIQE